MFGEVPNGANQVPKATPRAFRNKNSIIYCPKCSLRVKSVRRRWHHLCENEHYSSGNGHSCVDQITAAIFSQGLRGKLKLQGWRGISNSRWPMMVTTLPDGKSSRTCPQSRELWYPLSSRLPGKELYPKVPGGPMQVFMHWLRSLPYPLSLPSRSPIFAGHSITSCRARFGSWRWSKLPRTFMPGNLRAPRLTDTESTGRRFVRHSWRVMSIITRFRSMRTL